MNKIVYANLGANCGERNMYIRSTDIEQGNWASLLMSFPDEALYYMTKGKDIVIIDKCNKQHGKVQRIFCPVFQDFLRKIRCEQTINNHLREHLDWAMQAYRNNRVIRRKYEFFKHRLSTLNVRARTIWCKHEPTIWRQD